MTAYNFTLIEPYTQNANVNGSGAKFLTGTVQVQEFEYAFITTGLVNGDTITTPLNGLPVNGCVILETEVIASQLDTNATPTGTFNLGDAALATRFINSAFMGTGNAFGQLKVNINKAQTLAANNVVTAGAGFLYPDGSNPQLVLTVNAALATTATTGYIRLKVFYNCDGDV
jgi:hypothetical protein